MSDDRLTPRQIEGLELVLEVCRDLPLGSPGQETAESTLHRQLYYHRHALIAAAKALTGGVESAVFAAMGHDLQLVLDVPEHAWDAARALVGQRVLIVPLDAAAAGEGGG